PNGPSKVFAYSPDGRLLRTYVIKGQNPNGNNGVQVAAMDARGLLYLLDQSPPRVLTLDPRTGAQSTYATFKDVPPCPPPGIGNECSATVMDNPPEPDYAAWGPTGELYVTDYQQGLVWRVPPAGGLARDPAGNAYRARGGPQSNQLVEISPTGQEIARVTHDGSGGPNDVPFDEPSSVQFDGERMIVTNDAYFSGDASHFVLFDVF